MNIFNKIIIVLILLILICASIIGIFNSFTGWFKWSDMAAKVFNPNTNYPIIISAPILLLVIILCIFLLILEFYRRKIKTALVASIKEGVAVITLDSVARQVKESLSKIAGVSDMNVKIEAKSKGVIINIYSKICADCNVPLKMQEILKNASDFTLKKLGIKVYRTNLTITNLSNIEFTPEKQEKSKEVNNEPEIQILSPVYDNNQKNQDEIIDSSSENTENK